MTSRTIYHELGLTPIINAAGTFTDWGGSRMSPEVLDAWRDAAGHFVDLRKLQDRVAERIAARLGVEAAMVTGGAASSILLGTAAAITLRDPGYPTSGHVSPTDAAPIGCGSLSPYHVLRPRDHRDPYDRQIAACGTVVVNVDSPEQFAELAGPRAVMAMFYNVHEPDGVFRHRQWLELARRHQLPTLLDAAADVPPQNAFRELVELGYDMVAVSGGKAIGGPQDTGLLLGRAPFIAAARQNASPWEGVIGRAVKVSKEDLVALWRAVERFMDCDATQWITQCDRQLAILNSLLHDLPTLQTRRIIPRPANNFPHLLLHWDETRLALSPVELAERLLAGDPPIATARVAGTGETGFLLSVINLQPGEAEIVGKRVRELLMQAERPTPTTE